MDRAIALSQEVFIQSLLELLGPNKIAKIIKKNYQGTAQIIFHDVKIIIRIEEIGYRLFSMSLMMMKWAPQNS